MRDSVRRSRRVEHKVVNPGGGWRPVAQHAGGAISRLPRDFGYPDSQLAWLVINPACGCCWGWVLDRDQIKPGTDARLATCGQIEDELRHTAVHHLVSGGFSQTHHAAPGCSR